ncbi:N-6 DNA methylase [Streptomyces diacarni]|uniref:Eco57I restriction-modification methylase domain-containing protein n=1 Tax=Streptomyces diacarni TaxID=2800381 RepID=UPI0033E3DB68
MTALDHLPASTAVRIEGRLLSPDLVNKIRLGDTEVPGTAPADYGLARGTRVADVASRKWEGLKAGYLAFQDDLAKLGDNSDPTKATREWLLQLLEELGYGRLARKRGGITVPGRKEPYRPSHCWQEHVPVHLVGWNTDLDRAVGTRRAPQSMVQELLNASAGHLWGILSNGHVLRLLRDSTALVGSAYVEFNLEAIFGGDQFADFLLLYAMLHASRLELVPKPEKRRGAGAAARGDEASAGGAEDERESEAAEDGQAPDDEIPLTPADCRLEWWREYAVESGIRARNQLREQVKQALSILGTGFLQKNPQLAQALTHRGLPALYDFHHELLRLAYQLIFLCVAEDRDALLLRPGDRATKAEIKKNEEARDHYDRYFSTARLRRIAAGRQGDHHTDLWAGLCHVLDALGTNGGMPSLALPGLGGLYFRPENIETFAAGANGSDPAASAGTGALAPSRLPGAPEPLRAARLPNQHLLEAVRLLSRIRDKKGRLTRVDFRHLGADELGSVYESLLELIPRRNADNEFWLQDLVAGSKRKTTGSYYTPVVVIEKLLDNALTPVIDRYAASGVPDHLLDINVVDPACGSGHVLVAAARRIALRYAQMQHGEVQPAPEHVRDAMAKVVRSCIHGVDIEPLSAELAKVSLWLESLTPGKPLAYLDDRIKTGNALLGATPVRLERGIPNGAFQKLEGDDGSVVRTLRKQNEKERGGQTALAVTAPLVQTGTARVRVAAEEVARYTDGSLAEIREHARRHAEFEKNDELRLLKRVADTWCAAFLWPKREGAPVAITSAVLRELEKGGRLAGIVRKPKKPGEKLPEETEAQRAWREEAGERELREIVSRNRFFHWHLEFPRVFRVEDRDASDANPDTGWQGGFDAVLGNPPWERVKIQKKEWFAARDERIADAETASIRDRKIEELRDSVDEFGDPNEGDRKLYGAWLTAQRESKGLTVMLRDSELFPLAGTGDVNTYAVFAEKARSLIGPKGMSGLVLPTGIATDKTTSAFFADLVERRQLVTVLDMENEEKLFRDVHNQYRFSLFTVAGRALGERYPHVRLAFRARRPDQLDAREFTLDADGFRRINPNTRTAPVCEGPEYLRVLERVHSTIPVLRSRPGGRSTGNAWDLGFHVMFHMSADSDLFRSGEDSRSGKYGTVFFRGGERFLPLYEGKFIHHFDGRFATYENATQAQINKGTLPRLGRAGHADPAALPLPRHWIDESEVDERLTEDKKRARKAWAYDWLMGWRDVCRASDDRTVISSVLPRTAVGHTAPLLLPNSPGLPLHCLLANLSAFVLDFSARQKMQGAHLTYTYLEQLPALAPEIYVKPARWLQGKPPAPWIRDRVLELTYTSYEMAPWAEYLGDSGPPFVWDEKRRFLMRAELDAAFFHLYGIERADVDLVLDSFRAFRNKQPALFQETKDEIIRVYEAMADGKPFSDPDFGPPPGHGPRHPAGTSPLTRKTSSQPAGRRDQPKASRESAPAANETGEDAQRDQLFGREDIEGQVQLDLFE